MTDAGQLIEAMDGRVRRREERRDFFKAAFGLGAAALGGAAALTLANRADAQTALTDVDYLNFALNLEYLEAQFYSYAATGQGIAANLQTGTGTQGAVQTGSGATQARRVAFADAGVAAYAREIAADEVAHVTYLRSQLTTNAIAQPAINIAGGAGGPFAAAATAAGIPNGSTFDPYASDDNFLLGAFIFEDVGVTAYQGAIGLITNKGFIEAAAGIHAVEAYHAAIVRTTLYARGVATPALRTYADQISNARDILDGRTDDNDQGISSLSRADTTTLESNIVPVSTTTTVGSGVVFPRTPGQVLNIVFLNNLATRSGGFFPAGVNGNAALITSASSN